MGKGKLVLLFFAVFFLMAIVHAECNNNGVCDSGENRCSCANDCGACGGTVSGELCERYTCIADDCIATMVFNCCGNDICESGENFASCDIDCAPKNVSVSLLEFEDLEYYRGDNVLIKVSVEADGVAAKWAAVKAKGFFGELTLYDDAKHGDGGANNGVYANTLAIPKGIDEGEYFVTIEANKKGVVGFQTLTISVNPLLGLKISPDRELYVLGDVIVLNGSMSKRKSPLVGEISIRFVSNGKSIFSTMVQTDEAGSFSLDRHTSLIDPPGEWLIEATASDENNNTGFAQEVITILSADGTGYLDVEFIEPIAKAFNRGEEIDFLVRIEDPEGNPVEGASAGIVLQKEIEIPLKSVSPGNYAGKFPIPLGFPLGEQEITAIVSKEIGGILYAGFSKARAFINMAGIDLRIDGPAKSTFKIGETIEFSLRLLYDNARPVEHASLDLNINGKIMRATEKGDGHYYFKYLVPDENFEEFGVIALVEDASGNTLERALGINVKPEPHLLHFLTGNPVFLAALMVMALLAAVFAVLIGKNVLRMRFLTAKKMQLIELKKKLQHQYFNEGSLGSHEYYLLLDKYNGELEKVETQINLLEKK